MALFSSTSHSQKAESYAHQPFSGTLRGKIIFAFIARITDATYFNILHVGQFLSPITLIGQRSEDHVEDQLVQYHELSRPFTADLRREDLFIHRVVYLSDASI